jgi:hypothetical protein
MERFLTKSRIHLFIHFIFVHLIYIWHKPPQDIEHVNLHIKLHIQKDNVIIKYNIHMTTNITKLPSTLLVKKQQIYKIKNPRGQRHDKIQ